MSRTQKLTPGSEAVSNVIPLRPGIVVSAPQPELRKRQKSYRKSTPKGSSVGSMTPSCQAENGIDTSKLAVTPGSLPLPGNEGSGSSILRETERDKAAFRKLISKLSNGQLRERFPLEAHSHNDMKKRGKTHGAVVHPKFEDFRSFLLVVGPRPAPQYTLDRVNPHDPEYAPGKVRWADKRTQANNRRNTIYLTADGEILPLATWARRRKVDPKTLRKRRDYGGWTDREIIYGRDARAPEQPVEPLPRAGGAISDFWPVSTCDRWESSFQSFVAHAKHDPRLSTHPERAFTREVFMAWLGGNFLTWLKDGDDKTIGLRAEYPGYDDPEHDVEPSEVRDDPRYRYVEIFSVLVRRAWSATLNDPAQDNLLQNYLRNYRVYLPPLDWSKVFKRRERRPEED